jgi:hypothetical protein
VHDDGDENSLDVDSENEGCNGDRAKSGGVGVVDQLRREREESDNFEAALRRQML